MTLSTDHGGLESLPLKLMIVAVIASLSIIPAGNALDKMRTRDYVNKVELQLEWVASTAELLAIGGPGGVRTIELDFTGQSGVKFESLTIGDEDGGPNMSSVVLRFLDRGVMVETCSDPPVWLRAKDGKGLVIDTPRIDLRLSAQLDGRTEYVLVEAV